MIGMRNRAFPFALFITLASALCAAAPVRAGESPRLTNADIIAFVQAGVAPQLILDRIRTGDNAFDMSTRSAISLKESGVPDDVIAAMLVSAGDNAMRNLPTLSPLPTLNATATNPPGANAMQAPSGFSQPVQSVGAGARFSNELANIAGGSPEARRAAVAWMLANKANSLAPLREAMKDPRPEMQAAAIHALGGLNDRESIPAIRQHVLNPSPVVRRSAAEALVAMNDADAIVAAEKSLGQSVAPQDGFIRIIGYARPVRAVGELTRILGSSPVALDRAAAAWALAQIGPPAGTALPVAEAALANDADPEVRREAARAIAGFHNPASAGILQDACRRDPEVRKITLEAMAEYPETMDFLASVMNLGADQIAADELEAARRSLHTLTGQDFGLDGSRWTAWVAQNGVSGGGVSAGIPGAGALPPAGSIIASAPQTDMIGAIPDPAVSSIEIPRSNEVDIAQWGIVVDSADIPMVPEVDNGGGQSVQGLPPGLAGLAGLLNQQAAGQSAFAPAGDPAALSASDFGGAETGAGGGGSLFRNWEPDPRSAASAAALPPPPTTSSTWDRAAAPGASAFTATLPTAPASSGGADLSGVRLPPPPAAGGADSGFSGIYTPDPAQYVDTSGYGGSASYTDELHSEDLSGTAQFAPDDESYADSGFGMTDPNFIPSDMPMEEYADSGFEDDDGFSMPPPPGGGFLSGADDDEDGSFGMTDDMSDMAGGASAEEEFDEDGGMALPPFGGSGGSARADDADSGSPFLEDFEDGEFDSGETATVSSAPPPFPVGDMEDESAIVSDPVSSGGRAASPRRERSVVREEPRESAGASVIVGDSLEALQADIENALGDVPKKVLSSSGSSGTVAADDGDIPVAAPPAARSSSRPRKGESVWIPGEDDDVAETAPAAPAPASDSAAGSGKPAARASKLDDDPIEDTSFEILEGEPSEYMTLDQLSDVYIQQPENAGSAEPAESMESVETQDAETEAEPEPAAASETPSPVSGISLPLSGAVSESDVGDYLESDPYGDFAPAAPVDSAASLPLPLPPADETAEAAEVEPEPEMMVAETTELETAEPEESADAESPGAYEYEVEADAVVEEAYEDDGAYMTEADTETGSFPPPPEPPPAMRLTLPGDFAAPPAPQDLSEQELPDLPPFDAGLPPITTGQSQSGDFSVPPLEIPPLN